VPITPNQNDLLRQAANEQDSEKLLELVKQVNRSFDKDAEKKDQPVQEPAQ
jgi:hypothetical protein